jgi:hypothetical protein
MALKIAIKIPQKAPPKPAPKPAAKPAAKVAATGPTSYPKPKPPPAAQVPKSIVSQALKIPASAAKMVSQNAALAQKLDTAAARGSEPAKILLTAAGLQVSQQIKNKVVSLAGDAMMGNPAAASAANQIIKNGIAAQADPNSGAAQQQIAAAEMLADAFEEGDYPRESVLPSNGPGTDMMPAPAGGPAPDGGYEGTFESVDDADEGDDEDEDEEDEEEDEEDLDAVEGVGALKIKLTLREALIIQVRSRLKKGKPLTQLELLSQLRKIRLAFKIRSRGGRVGCC